MFYILLRCVGIHSNRRTYPSVLIGRLKSMQKIHAEFSNIIITLCSTLASTRAKQLYSISSTRNSFRRLLNSVTRRVRNDNYYVSRKIEKKKKIGRDATLVEVNFFLNGCYCNFLTVIYLKRLYATLNPNLYNNTRLHTYTQFFIYFEA